jgi:hypothetical protein
MATTQSDDGNRGRQHPGLTESQSAYWRGQYRHEPYYRQGAPFEAYEPAYRTGAEGRRAHPGERYEDVEVRLRSNYASHLGNAAIGWDEGAGQACRAAWDRAGQMPSDGRDRHDTPGGNR